MSVAWRTAMFVTTGSTSRMRNIGGPCADCWHGWQAHGVVCDMPPERGGDDSPMCNDCVVDWDEKEDNVSACGAFHDYIPTPLVVRM